MSLPAGVATCTVRIEPSTTHTGEPVSIRAVVEPSHTVIHAATGRALAKIPAESSGDEGLVFTLPQDQPGFTDSAGNGFRGWGYVARIELTTGGKSQHLRKAFTIPEGITDVDLLKVIDGPAAAPVMTPAAVVTSVNGATGAVTAVPFAQLAADPYQLFVGEVTRDASGAATSAAVVWPDGTEGTYTGTPSATFAGAIDAYTITYGETTYTQPAVTRDSAGNITNRPAIITV